MQRPPNTQLSETASSPSAAGKPKKPVSNLQSLERAITLLQASAYSESGLRLTELAEQVGLSRSTAHRILSWLVAHGLLRMSSHSWVYTPGDELYRLGQAAARFLSLIDIARPCMQRMADTTEDTVFLSVIDGKETVCVARVTGAYPIKTLTLSEGDRRPLGVGAGAMALLAAMPEKDRLRIIEDEAQRISQYPRFDAKWLLRAVAEAHRRGYTYNPQRVLRGMCAVGIAIQGSDGLPLCALSIAAISSRMKPARRAAIVAQLKQEGASLRRQLADQRTEG